ncbi:uncharacterized protein LOC142162076 [Nicotiana tabacum]|uniref:Uncharacterized protein LOC142162076 n=1 Tax=Nicotiana tabacum TaxID=4097 RepID=A0AC58RP50_TOBAC
MSPFKALYGYDPPQPTFELVAQSKVNSVDELLRERQIMSRVLQENLRKAQERMKLYADAKRTKRYFQEGDWVFLKLRPYRQVSMAVRRNLKLASKYYGPYQIVKKIEHVAYELKLPVGSKIHPIFHVLQLKKKVGNQVLPSMEPQICYNDGQILVEPVAILDRRMVKKKNKAAVKVLVQWANLSPEEATWEDYNFLCSQFPEFQP